MLNWYVPGIIILRPWKIVSVDLWHLDDFLLFENRHLVILGWMTPLTTPAKVCFRSDHITTLPSHCLPCECPTKSRFIVASSFYPRLDFLSRMQEVFLMVQKVGNLSLWYEIIRIHGLTVLWSRYEMIYIWSEKPSNGWYITPIHGNVLPTTGKVVVTGWGM